MMVKGFRTYSASFRFVIHKDASLCDCSLCAPLLVYTLVVYTSP